MLQTGAPEWVDVELRPPLPRDLQVEVTAACNLRCRMCLVRYRPPVDRVTGSMTLATFEALVDGLPEATDITLQGLGEPLLCPDLVAMVRAARARGMTVGFNTNATVLTEAKAADLIAAGVSWLRFSLDGATAATYEAIRDGACFDRVVRNIGRMAKLVRAAGPRAPDLGIVFVAMRSNVHELEAVVTLAADLGIGKVFVQNISHDFSDVGDDPAYAAIGEFLGRQALWSGDRDRHTAVDAFARARTMAERRGVQLNLPRVEEAARPRRAGEPGCSWPWQSSYVTQNGTVQPCCMVMGEDRAALGDVHTDGGLAGVWHGDRAVAFRKALLTDEPPEVCRGCALYRGVF